MKKRILIPFLIVILMITTAVAATLATAAEVDTFGMTLEASAPGSTSHFLTAKPGEEIKVSVIINDNFADGIQTLQTQVSFDIDALEYVSFENGDVFPKAVKPSVKVNTSKKAVTIQITDLQSATNLNNKEGVLINLIFKVKEGQKGEIGGFSFLALVVSSNNRDLTFNKLDKAEITNEEDKIYACNFGEPETIEPSCTAPGSITYTCTDCGEQVVIPNGEGGSGHKEVIDEAKNPTCTEDGLTEGSHCEICGETIKEQTTVKSEGHKFGEWVTTKEPTETAKGEQKQTCTVCGTSETRELAALEHSCKAHLKEVKAKAATCIAKGNKAYHECEGCHKFYSDANATTEITDKTSVEIGTTEHTSVVIPAKAATCTEKGNTAGLKCSVCGHIMQATTEIPAKNHNPVVVKGKDSTCMVEGLTDGTKCSTCNTVIDKQTIIPKKNHTLVTLPAKDATCSATGLTEGSKCSVCNTVVVAQNEVPTKTHTYGEWSVVKNATATEDGSMERICTACSFKETVVIPATGVDTNPPATTPDETDPPATTPEVTTPEVTTPDQGVTTPDNVDNNKDNNGDSNKLLGVIVILVALIVVAGVVILILLKKKKN